MMDNLARMHPVPVRDIWPSEDRNFTPWLARNIDLLGDALGFDLEGAETEVSMPDGRRADIVALYGDQTAIIENQLEASDDDHFVRLLYYASCRNAKTLIWVAPAFARMHRENMAWLNRKYGVDGYCVELSVWRMGDSTAPMLRRIVPAKPVDPQTVENLNFERLYRNFYRSLRDRFAAAGFDHTAEPGWVASSNFLWFRTPYEGVHYSVVHADEGDGRTQAFLLFNASDPDPRLAQLKDDYGDASDLPLEWHTGEETGESWVSLSTDASDADLEDPEAPREWMFSNLVLLRDTLEPHLEKLFAR